MVILRVRRIVYEEGEFDVGDVMSLKVAAEFLGLSLQSVINQVNRGKLTELVDEDSIHAFRNRRYVLRSEIEEMAERRQRQAEKWGEKASLPNKTAQS